MDDCRLRAAQPMADGFRRRDGLLWLGDVGQDRLEEIDASSAGDRPAACEPRLGRLRGRPAARPQALSSTGGLTWPVAAYAPSRGPMLGDRRRRLPRRSAIRRTARALRLRRLLPRHDLDARTRRGAQDRRGSTFAARSPACRGSPRSAQDGRGELYARVDPDGSRDADRSRAYQLGPPNGDCPARQSVSKRFGATRAADVGVADGPERGVRRAARPERLRQDDAAALDRRLRGAGRGRDPDRRQGRSPAVHMGPARAPATSAWSSRTTRCSRT